MLLYTAGIYHSSIISKQSVIHHHDTTTSTNDSVFPLDQGMFMCSAYICIYTYVQTVFCYCYSSYCHCYCITGALSIADDYCVSYTVTMMDVRSCTRPPRILDQLRISEYSHMSLPPRSPDLPTNISKCTNISRQLGSFYPHSSTIVGELYYYCVSCKTKAPWV